MPEAKHHDHTTFCWNQLATTDIDEAIVYYTSLFGWDVADEDLAGGESTIRLTLNGRFVAGLHALSDKEMEHGWKARWEPFLQVNSITEMLERTREHHGNVLEPMVSAGSHGTLATISSPSGAALCLWEAGNFPGQGWITENNAPAWHTLIASSMDVEHEFWTALTGWNNVTDNPEGSHGLFTLGSNTPLAGTRIADRDLRILLGRRQTQWIPHIQVQDCDSIAAEAEAIGGTIIVAPEDVLSIGRQALIADPQGGTFGVITPAVRTPA